TTLWVDPSSTGNTRRRGAPYGFTWADKYPASAWLRRDIGLSEEVVTREWNRVDEIRRKYSGWV
ncbi:hypothetical protein WN73_12140, partial [Bradyrhizobium sp. CCBAU 45394]